ncbi:MAG: choice-of-anchor L domain-containing protein [Flavobacteriales bacterium]|nr:choice-of-anchor L domain-containing protein [Flavobacteriales bacterium]
MLIGARAQLVVTGSVPPATVVQDVLLGPGVTASNITYTGNIAQLGTFVGVNCFLGLDSGMVMSSGAAFGAAGPNNTDGFTLPSGGYDGPGDNDLWIASGSGFAQSYDAAVLQFDFVPTGDSLSFRFVFASEEYLEFVNSINDVFGFFLSGPGITGPYSNNAANIALIPGTTMPVSINNVNNNVNSAYYIVNGDGTNAPYNSNPQYIQYDGLTTVLTANANVICGETYHIKIAISDISDGILDSGVFLEAGSFQSNSVLLSAQINGGGADSTLYEGCGNATFHIVRQGDLSFTDTVALSAGGIATEGVDYNGISSQLIFLPGEDTLSITVSALLDGVPEPPELIDLMAVWTGDCGSDTANLHFYIADTPPILLSINADTMLTCQDSTLMQAQVSGGFGMLTLDWNTGLADGDTAAWLHPPQTTLYILSVTDECGVFNPVDSMLLSIFEPDTFVLAMHPDTLVHCPETPLTLFGAVSGGTPPYTYAWAGGLGAGAQLAVAPPVTQTFALQVQDLCGNLLAGATTVTVDYDSVRVHAGPDTLICYHDSITVRAFPSAGYGAINLHWYMGATIDSIRVNPQQLTHYWVVATDQCAISDSAYAAVEVERPIADFTIDGSVWESTFPIVFRDLSTGAISWAWDFGTAGLYSTEVNPVITYPGPGTFPVQLAIVDTLGCVDTLVKFIRVAPEFNLYLPNAFSPDGDGINEVFAVQGTGILKFKLQIFDRWGRPVFETEDPAQGWDGTIDGQRPVPGIYPYLFRFLGPAGQTADRYGSVMLVR